MTDEPLSPFDSAQFRKVLGHFPTGVTIVTGWSGDTPCGFTIGSFTSVSLDPPLVGFLPMIASDTWQAMAPAGKFCVNVLRDDQADLCWRFAKSGVGDDHFMVVGRVVDLDHHAGPHTPLVFYKGALGGFLAAD